jgi:ABC-type multidrug transport system fused ATPase/permease subunit
MNLIQEIKKDSIILFITHRMTTTQKCDQILILEDGCIVESGRPKELKKIKNNLYHKFWNIQVENKE